MFDFTRKNTFCFFQKKTIFLEFWGLMSSSSWKCEMKRCPWWGEFYASHKWSDFQFFDVASLILYCFFSSPFFTKDDGLLFLRGVGTCKRPMWTMSVSILLWISRWMHDRYCGRFYTYVIRLCQTKCFTYFYNSLPHASHGVDLGATTF